MIITRAMPTQQTAIIGVSRRITAGQEFKAGLCRAPAQDPPTTTSQEPTFHQGGLVERPTDQEAEVMVARKISVHQFCPEKPCRSVDHGGTGVRAPHPLDAGVHHREAGRRLRR